MGQIDALIAARILAPAGLSAGDVPVWNGTTWAKPGGARTGTNFLRDDGTYQAVSAGGLQLIAHQVLGSSQAAFDTNTLLGGNIPGTYTHLRLVLLQRDVSAGSGLTTSGMVFNNDTGANYDLQYTEAQGSVTASAEAYANTNIGTQLQVMGGSAAGLFGYTEVDIPFYASTVAQKVAMGQSVSKIGVASGDIRVRTSVAYWRSTAALTRIAVTASGASFATGSAFYLYGIL